MKSIEVIEEDARERNDAIKKAILSGDSVVQKFYDNAVVFITGGSGFIGKHMIEKIIRSTNVNKIYILLRVKKEKPIQERLKDVLDDLVFEELLKEQPNFIDKLKPIEGSCDKDNIGISEKDWMMLSDEVNIILHSAASTNFRENLKSATSTNIKGTREILRLAKACKHLKSVVHVSTAYSNATRSRNKGDVKEDFYESPVPPEKMLQLAENLDNYQLNILMETYMQEWPNSYTFTKAIAEDLVRDTGGDLPVCIVRPAIVISAYKEPSLGWVDLKNVYGPSGIVLGLIRGVIHTILADNNINMDFVPVDISTNAIITAALETHERYTRGSRDPIIYTVSGKRNPITFREVISVLINGPRVIIPSKAVWYSHVVITRCKFVYLMLTVLLHYIPAIMIDGCCLLIGQKPRFLKLYKSVYTLTSELSYFAYNEWKFHDGNTLNLYNKLSKTDKVIYNCDMSSIDIREAVFIWSYGVAKYIVKDDMTNREYALRKQSLLKIVHYLVLPLYLYALFKLALAFITFLYYVVFF